MKNYSKILAVIGLVFLLSSCYDSDRSRKVRYMGDTDMYKSVPYYAYDQNPILPNDMASLKPVKNTISRGDIPYIYPNSEEGYQAAKDSLQSPLWIKKETDSVVTISEKNLDKGKYLYNIYCAICHGTSGDGQGDLVKNEKFLGVPNYKDRDITEGSIYHVIMYGRGLMGSHAPQLTEKERWQVVHYVEQLRKDLLK
ncbi:MAG: cytochrome C [Flavobacteriales bacterium]|nr:MAG: cytochrome C [Flavobacteriales bacterium]